MSGNVQDAAVDKAMSLMAGYDMDPSPSMLLLADDPVKVALDRGFESSEARAEV